MSYHAKRDQAKEAKEAKEAQEARKEKESVGLVCEDGSNFFSRGVHTVPSRLTDWISPTLLAYVFSESVERRKEIWALTMVRKLDFLEGRLVLGNEIGVG
jgi:hypothetical protein